MNRPIPETETMKISEVKSHLSSLVNAVYRHEKRVVIEKSGIPVAVVVSVEDMRALAQLDEERAERWRLLELMREPFRGVPAEEIEREAAKAIAEVRAERRTHDEIVAKRMGVINAMREAFKGVPPEEIERETAKAVAEVRAEMKAERESVAKSA